MHCAHPRQGRLELNGFIADAMPPNLVGLAVSGSSIYWGSTVPYIARAAIDGQMRDDSFLQLANPPSGIAVARDHIYWGNGQGTTIGRAGLTGGGTLAQEVDENFIRLSGNPDGLATDGTFLYWTAGGAIGRANLDGTGVNQAFITGASVPQGVTIGG